MVLAIKPKLPVELFCTTYRHFLSQTTVKKCIVESSDPRLLYNMPSILSLSKEKVSSLYTMKALKHIVVYFLILNIIGSSLMVPLIYLDFELRRDYIAEVLCINRDEPITVCGGKCYLDLRLEQAAEQREQESQSNSRPVEIYFFNEERTTHKFSYVPGSEASPFLSYVAPGTPRTFAGDIFRPPQHG